MFHRKSFLNGWLTGLTLASLTFSVVFVPVMSVAQRNPGDRTGGGRDSVAPRRDDAAPRRDYSPPPSRREDSAPPPRREDSPPRRESPPPPPPRREEPPRRDYSPPPREYAPPPKREDPPARREQPPARRDEPPARREDSTPRREDPGARREERGAAPGFGDRTGANRTENERRFNRDGNNGGVLEPERPGNEPRRPAQDRNSRPDRAPDRADSERRLNRDGNNAGVLEPAPQRRDPGGRPGFNPGDRTGRDRNADRNDTSDGAADRLQRSENRVNPGLDRQEREDSSLSTTRNKARDIFTRSVEGRRYENGLTLRGGVRVYHNNLRVYFRNDYCHYPFYSPTYDYGYVYYSPYYVYYGVCPPYIYRRHAYYRPPTVIYIEIPIYSGNYWRGYRNTYDDDYYLYRDYARDRQVDQAVREIEEAFRYCDIERLVYVTDPRTRIAIFRKGRYDYSLDANDYLDITRDFMRSIDTLEFDIYRVRRVSSSVYVASAKHIYRDHANRRRTVYLSFALERPYGRWVISQVDTSPEYIEE
jgi:hypothetical protein